MFDSANYRYRAIPTKEEFNKYFLKISKDGQSSATINWLGAVYDTKLVGIPDEGTLFYPIDGVTNNIDDLKFAVSKCEDDGFAIIPYYDNIKQGWVLGTINFDGVDISTNSAIDTIIRDLRKYGFSAVFPDEFIRFTQQTKLALGFYDGQVDTNYLNSAEDLTLTAGNGLAGQTIGAKGLPMWIYEVPSTWYTRNTLPQNVYGYLTYKLKPYINMLEYEVKKHVGVRSVITPSLSFDALLTKLFELRDKSHIKSDVLMENANTPEIIPSNGGDELLQEYLSSAFRTRSDSSDWFDDVMEHFNETYAKWINIVLRELFV